MKESRRRPGRRMPFRNVMRSGTGVDWRATFRACVLLMAVVAVFGGVIAYSVVRRGLSAHAEPSAVEEMLARAMRRWATPQAVRHRGNPITPSPDVFDQALMHYADHCAACHANDGSGDTSIGRGLYPRVPDMRGAATQSLTDGELFSIIEHGIRLTGMPGWGNGTPEGERDSWGLVHLIRRLPTLSADEIEQMEALNPKSPDQWREEDAARRFLAGEDMRPSTTATHEHEGSRP